jgi:hypothetical protein
MMRVCLIVFVLFAHGGIAMGSHEALHVRDVNQRQADGLLSMCKASYQGSQGNPEAQWYVTESGYLAAVEEELLDRAIFWAGMGNEDEFMRFVASTDLVFPLKAGLRVFVEKFSFSGKVRIRPEGSDIAVWTIREAIRSELPARGT